MLYLLPYTHVVACLTNPEPTLDQKRNKVPEKKLAPAPNQPTCLVSLLAQKSRYIQIVLIVITRLADRRRSGVLRVNSIAELFYMAEVLGKQPRPKGKRLTILTNAGGPGVLATDALITNGGELTPISPEIMDAFNQLLPAAWRT